MQIETIFTALWAWFVGYLPGLAAAAVSLVVGWYLSRLAYHAIINVWPKARRLDRSVGPLLAQAARYGILLFSLVTALSFLGVASASIIAVLGAMGLAVALALQGTLANIAAGIMLVWLKPIAIGEYIQGDGVAGVVIEIGLFGTKVRSTAGLHVFIPNQKLFASAITNHSRNRTRRVEVAVTIPESIRLHDARDLLLGIAAADKRVMQDPAAEAHVVGFTGTTVSMVLRAWVRTADYVPTLYGLTEQAKLALDLALVGDDVAKGQVSVGPDPNTPSPEGQKGS